jgi:hypothetical protein
MVFKNKVLKIFILIIILIIASFPSIIGIQIISKNSNNFVENIVFDTYNLNCDPFFRLHSENLNLPPETPQKPTGPDEWVLDFEAAFKTSTTDTEGNDIYYMFDWGDGSLSEWLGPYASGEIVIVSHIWTIIGNYEIKVKAKDIYQAQSKWSESAIISIIENTPPEKAIIIGPKIGITKKYHYFSINSTDQNGHDLYYYVNWGDGDYLNWVGPYSSGETVTFSHTWNANGNYVIIVLVKDQFGLTSPQSEFQFSVIKNRASTFLMLTNVFEYIMERTFLLKNPFL